MTAQLQTALTILRRKQVEARTGLAKSTIYSRIQSGTFPAPIQLGEKSGGCVGWVESDISAWIADRIEASRTAAARG